MTKPSGLLRGGGRRVDEARNLVKPVCFHAPANNVERADDAGQKIIEVVGDPAGKLADRVHFLGLTQGLLSCRQFDFRSPFGCNISASAIDIAILKNADPRNPTIAAVFATVSICETQRGLADLRQFEARAWALSRSRILLVNAAAYSRTALRKINHLGPSTSARNPPKMGYSWRV